RARGTSIRLQEVEDISPDLGRVLIPFVDPVAVDLPVWAGQRVATARAPLLNGLMGLMQPVVGTEMRRRGDKAGRGCRADDLTDAGERRVKLDTHLQIDLAVPVDRDVPASAGDLVRPQLIPH